MLNRVRPFATLWPIAHQAPPSMAFSRQEYWSGLPFSSLGDLPDPGIEPRCPTLQADALPSESQGSPNNRKKILNHNYFLNVQCLLGPVRVVCVC